MLSCCSAWPVKACIEIGTSCMLCVRRWAVTVISSIVSVLVCAGAAAVAGACACLAYAAPPDTPLRMAAIAHDSFGFEFMLHPQICLIIVRIESLPAPVEPGLDFRPRPDPTPKTGRHLIRSRHDPV